MFDFAEILREKYGEKLDEARLDRDHMENKIKDEDIWFIENQKAGMLIRKKNQEWTTIPGFCKNYGILNQKDFELMLRVLDRNKVRVVNTFKKSNSDELNLMSKEAWIDPKHIVAGDYNPILEAVMESLSDGDPEARIHIMHWIGAKYLDPSDFMIPALSIYGSQNVGKGIFTNRILPTIFGGRQVFHAHSEDIIGTFNSHAVIGRSIVCVDESNLSKKTDDRLKQLIGNPKVLAHPKGLTPFEVDNCIAYVFTSNDMFGGMKLDSDVKSNRRFSMINVERTLPEWFEKHNLDFDKEYGDGNITNVCKDPVEVGKLLFDCIEIAKTLGKIKAYHGADYHEVMESQHPLNEFFRDVFIDNPPISGYVVNSDLYDDFKDWKTRTDPGGYIISQTKLTQEVKKWAKSNLRSLRYEVRSVIGKSKRVFAID